MSTVERSREVAAERLELALDMFEVGLEMFRLKLKRKNPNLSALQIEEQVEEWLQHRPGAEAGDAVGRSVSWSRR